MRRVLRVLAVLLVVLVAVWFGVCGWLALRHPPVRFTEEELQAPLRAWPGGFLWGTATAAHQIEGGNHNDWTRFEAAAGHVENGDSSAVAADGWNRMLEDVTLMRAIGANAYRFSIEWSRLEPADGRWDEAAWARYGGLLKALRRERITPMVTLLHFTLPLWLADRGGVTAPEFPARFARFASEAGRRLGPDVDLWITLNEPNVQVYQGYVSGQWPPAHTSPAEAAAAWVGLLRAHAAAAAALRAADPGCAIGVANNLLLAEPKSRLLLTDWIAADRVNAFWDWPFENALRDGRARLPLPGASVDLPMPELRGTADFFGLNYYFRHLVRFAPGQPNGIAMEPGPGLRSELGGNEPAGDSPPEALYLLLREAWRRYQRPIYVTEGGIADDSGTLRGPLIRGQALAIQRAQAEGMPVRGYLHWSLYDNFEWDKGYRPRFGLFRVDRATLARTPAGGAAEFAALAPR